MVTTVLHLLNVYDVAFLCPEMEVLAAAGSVAGLASLAGHAIQSILKICNFLKDMKHAPADMHHLSRNLGHLRCVFEQVKAMEGLESASQPDTMRTLIALINECLKDLDAWLAWIESLTPGSSRYPKTWGRRFRSVGNKARLAAVQDQVASYRENITLSLNLLGRYGEHHMTPA